MISFGELTKLILSQQAENECFHEFEIAFRNDLIEEVGPGTGWSTADTALKIFYIRDLTTWEAGIQTYGFPATLKNLMLRPADEVISLRHLRTSSKIFTVFISETSGELIGCICVPERNRKYQDFALE